MVSIVLPPTSAGNARGCYRGDRGAGRGGDLPSSVGWRRKPQLFEGIGDVQGGIDRATSVMNCGSLAVSQGQGGAACVGGAFGSPVSRGKGGDGAWERLASWLRHGRLTLAADAAPIAINRVRPLQGEGAGGLDEASRGREERQNAGEESKSWGFRPQPTGTEGEGNTGERGKRFGRLQRVAGEARLEAAGFGTLEISASAHASFSIRGIGPRRVFRRILFRSIGVSLF
jgi:hypothetical protein